MTTEVYGENVPGVRDFSAGRREEFGVRIGTQAPTHVGTHKKNPIIHTYENTFLGNSASTNLTASGVNFGRQQTSGKVTDLVGVGGLRVGKFGPGKTFFEFCVRLWLGSC